MLNSKKANIIISIVIAVVVWAYVVGAVDPVTTKGVSDVKLTIRGTEELLVRGLAIKKPETRTIELNIKGKRSRVQNIDPSRIKATVNVSECSAGDNELSVSYSLPSGLTVVDASTSDVHIEATETVTKRKNVKVKFTNEADNEEVGNVRVSPSVINVSGSKSQINKVAYVKGLFGAGVLAGLLMGLLRGGGDLGQRPADGGARGVIVLGRLGVRLRGVAGARGRARGGGLLAVLAATAAGP